MNDGVKVKRERFTIQARDYHKLDISQGNAFITRRGRATLPLLSDLYYYYRYRYSSQAKALPDPLRFLRAIMIMLCRLIGGNTLGETIKSHSHVYLYSVRKLVIILGYLSTHTPDRLSTSTGMT